QLTNKAEPIRIYDLEIDYSVEEKGTAPLEKSGPPRLSIVVLPFANIGGDPEQDYFVDGVTESLTTDLSEMSGMLVIGRNTALSYKGKPVDLKQIGRELNVRYILEGSGQRSGNRMRVNGRLLMPRAAITYGPTASTSSSPTFSTCKTKSLSGLQTPSTLSCMPRPGAPSGCRIRIQWTSIFRE